MRTHGGGCSVVLGLALLCACGGNTNSPQGEVGGHCYPNGTCNVGLDCVGGVCVVPTDAAVATCGDGIVELDEQCDLGPANGGAVCDATCHTTCGNGIVDVGFGETCDIGIASGSGACPSACNDGQACTTDTLVSGGSCVAACAHTTTSLAMNGDGCCPNGATTTTDNDCPLACNNDTKFEQNGTLQSAYALSFGGSLSMTATTTSAGGTYSPKNVVATWVETQSAQFIKTIDRWANVRKANLVVWTASAGAADADAVSGATRADHSTPLSITWNLRDRNGNTIPDGTYTVRMELADTNTTVSGPNHEGTFTFTKGTAAQTQTGLSNGGFTNVSIAFSPQQSTEAIPNLAICPSGDIDIYRVDVDTAGTNVEVLTSYGANAAVLQTSLLNASGVSIANGIANGANATRVYVSNLPIGTYYVQVLASAAGENNYQLTVNRT